MPEDRPIPFILDTDIGDNVDDALALALACQSPELNLLGVTTVYRDPWRRAAIARAVLESLGRKDVPVAAGIEKPLLRAWDRQAPKHYEIDYSRHIEKLDRRHAVQFLTETAWAEARPIETALDTRFAEKSVREMLVPVTICCIGPLTNLAVALATEPTLAERIRVVLMGGMIGGDRLETNMAADPEAAQIVFSSGAEITMVGLDVTLECQMTTAALARLKSCEHEHARLLGGMIDAWMAESRRLPVLHDPLAVAMCFDAGLCTRQPMHVSVETADEQSRGRTVAQPSNDSSIKVCTNMARDRFIELFLNRICSAPRANEE